MMLSASKPGTWASILWGKDSPVQSSLVSKGLERGSLLTFLPTYYPGSCEVSHWASPALPPAATCPTSPYTPIPVFPRQLLCAVFKEHIIKLLVKASPLSTSGQGHSLMRIF